MYNVPISERILQMTEPENEEDSEKPKPFLQRIQLKGKSGNIVRATGQIDDGAMRNCISLSRWEHYRHCLDTLSKSKTIISMANTEEIESKGTWTEVVQVGGTSAISHFEVFDCKGAFDVILGKPWLKAVRAQHNYVTDKITIGNNGEQEVIMNILDRKEPTENTNPIYPQTTTEHQLAEEWAHITQLGMSDKTKYAGQMTIKTQTWTNLQRLYNLKPESNN